MDLEKAFDQVPWKGVWCVLRKPVTEEWIVGLVQGCMPMCRVVSVLVSGTVKSLNRRSVFTKAWYLARCSSSLCLKPCHVSSTLGSPWRTSMPMTLLSLLNILRNVSGSS